MYQNGFLIHAEMFNGILFREKLRGFRSKLSKVLVDADLANPIDLEDMFKNILSFLLVGLCISMTTLIVEIISTI